MIKLDKRGMVRLTERQIEQQIVDALTAHGWKVLRTNLFAGAVIQRQGSVEPGIPDLMAWRRFYVRPDGREWYPVRLTWIEVKRQSAEIGLPGCKLNAAQQKWWAAHPDEEKRVATCVEDIEDLLGVRRAA